MERFPSNIEDEFDEIEEIKEEYINAPLFQRIHISGEETTGVSTASIQGLGSMVTKVRKIRIRIRLIYVSCCI